MKKYVLNIDRLYSGQTANAVVLSQVDEDMPTLIPSVDDKVRGIPAFIAKWRKVHPDFRPESTSINKLNNYIVEFNLDLQTKFKERGHNELYMMDDTWVGLKPEERTSDLDKTYMHCLNGADEGGRPQLNVMFPYRKTTCKSIYTTQTSLESQQEVDSILENALCASLHGRVSYEKCVQSVSGVGEDMYIMSANVDAKDDNTFPNWMLVMNQHATIPHTLALFQPSQGQYEADNLFPTSFVQWYKTHNRKVVVGLQEEHGGNVTSLKILGSGSYVMKLATYSPTDVLVGNSPPIRLTADTYRAVMAEEDGANRYEDGQYIFDCSHGENVGIFFNLYNNFITDQERILSIDVPEDSDTNMLQLLFDMEVFRQSGVGDGMEVTVQVEGGDVPYTFNDDGPAKIYLPDASLSGRNVRISVRIHYDVDFHKRNTMRDYQDMLKGSGVALWNLRIQPVHPSTRQSPTMLTFGSYVNEHGLDGEERSRRYQEFWRVSQLKRNLVYQGILQSSLNNSTSSGLRSRNNYATGDVYGDVFATKSALDPRYDMSIELGRWNPQDGGWWGETEEDDCCEDGSYGRSVDMLKMAARNYIGMCGCANQLSLMYKPMDMAVGMDSQSGEVIARRLVNPEPELNYQMVEVVKNINRFESSIKHKSNVFSVVVENSNLAKSSKDESSMAKSELEFENYKSQLRNSITQFVRNACKDIVPVHTQLFDVQFR